MEIRIFGMTVRLEIIIITLIVGMIMGGHMLCACAKVPLSEAFLPGLNIPGLNDVETMEGAKAPASTDAPKGESETEPEPTVVPSKATAAATSKNGAEKISAETINSLTNLLPQALNGFQNILSGVTPPSSKDAFTDYSEYKGGENNSDVASSWINKAGAYSKNLGYQQTAQKSNAYIGTQVPLPDGELFFFQNNQFKPECCPSPYSASTGCACMSSEQVAYLNSRGGNRSSDSEF